MYKGTRVSRRKHVRERLESERNHRFNNIDSDQNYSNPFDFVDPVAPDATSPDLSQRPALTPSSSSANASSTAALGNKAKKILGMDHIQDGVVN